MVVGLLRGHGIRGTARVVGIDRETVGFINRDLADGKLADIETEARAIVGEINVRPVQSRVRVRKTAYTNNDGTCIYELFGARVTMRELVDISGLTRKALWGRMSKGMTAEQAISNLNRR